MRRSPLSSVIAFVVVVLALVGAVAAAGWSPLLGLDLQGGVAVVLRPTSATDDDQLNEAVAIIRTRVDAIGVAEPDITVQGGNVVVQLPGVKDRERALELVGSTAELRFRPVLQVLPSAAALEALTASTASTGVAPSTTAARGVSSTVSSTTGSSTTGSSTTGSSTTGSSTTGSSTTTPSPGSSPQQALAPLGASGAASGEYALASYRQESTSTTGATTSTAAPTTSSTPVGGSDTTAVSPATTTSIPASSEPGQIPEITPREQDTNEATVVLPQIDRETGEESARFLLGPTMVTGDALVAEKTTASIQQNGAWFVALTFKDGEQNVGGWRRAAAACFNATDPAVCPTGQLAAVLDGVVISAPTVNDTFSDTNEAVITGNFSQDDAKDLAQKLRYGALPVTFERQQSQDVSATIGRDALRAGIAAGLIGLAVVALYILLYYRILGLVALTSLGLSFGLLWVIIAALGETKGLALSLSGVVGIIVSIGVSIDSNIVYFEQIKDDMASGRTLRSSSQRAFRGAMSTIIKADLVSLIGAALLYFLTVGPVKGFALFLGLSALLDLVASYYFMRPAVLWMSRWSLASTTPKAFGIPSLTRSPAVKVAGPAAGEAHS